MIKNKKETVLLFLPIFVLLLWVASIHHSVSVNPRVRIPVGGYDPRDILAGRYMSIQTNYSSFETECQPRPKRAKGMGYVPLTSYNQEAYFCVDDKKVYAKKKPEMCKVFIKGRCFYNQFRDDVSRFYVPELNARELEALLQNPKVSTQIELSVSKDGRPTPVDLFFDGFSYKQFLK